MYKTEFNLVRMFVQLLRRGLGPWGMVHVAREFRYDRGRTDVLALGEKGKHLIAFEAKLEKWRDALDQAYRNTCFAQSSYVLLPRHLALRLDKHVRDFEYRNVGLCYIDGGKISIAFVAERIAPPERWLLDEARRIVEERRDASRWSRRRCPQNMPETSHEICRDRWRGGIQADLSCCR